MRRLIPRALDLPWFSVFVFSYRRGDVLFETSATTWIRVFVAQRDWHAMVRGHYIEGPST
jgi:hypothetical protein